jgi:hypothetical protein
MAIWEAVKTGILPAQSASNEPNQKKEAEQYDRQPKKTDLTVL